MNIYDWAIWLTGVVVGAGLFFLLLIWLPMRHFKKAKQRETDRNLMLQRAEQERCANVLRRNHRHLLVLRPSKHKDCLHWVCYDCPQALPFEVFWNREAFKEETIKGYERPKDQLAGWAG